MKKKLAILMVGLLAVVAIVTFASTISADDQKEVTQIDGTCCTTQYPVMRPDPETLREWVELYNSAPEAYIAPEIKMMLKASPRTSFSLLDRIEYDPVERDQGWCGNCWVWADTGLLEVALSAQEGIKDRLSVQYFASCYNEGVGEDWACCGGWASEFTDWYRANGLAIPWSNTNASWQDGNRTCGNLSSSVPCGNISTSPNYPITNCTTTRIETHGLGKETAIANIKNVLHQNKAIDFGFFLPNSEDWNNFFDFWSYEAEDTVWNPDFSSGHAWVNGEGGGHAVLCVGYNDTDPDNSYWIMLNSWGTTEGRPNGLFYLDMNMSYDCYFMDGHLDTYSFYWETIDVTFEIVEEPTTISITADETNYTVGDTQQFTATVYDQYGNTMVGVVISWTSTNTSVGTVSPTTATTGASGTATTTFSALAEGTTTITATNGTVSDSASVTVTPDWNPWDDDGVITTGEIQEAVSCWLTDTPKNGHSITTTEIQELVNMWLTT